MSPMFTKSVRIRAFLGAAGMALSLLAAGAQAAEAPVREQAVSYDDLNLSRQADAAAVYARLKAAAKDVCGIYDIRDLAMRQAHQACAAQALSAAVEDVDHATITALHSSSLRIRVAQHRRNTGSRL